MFSKLKNIYGSSLNVAKHILVPNFHLFFLVDLFFITEVLNKNSDRQRENDFCSSTTGYFDGGYRSKEAVTTSVWKNHRGRRVVKAEDN